MVFLLLSRIKEVRGTASPARAASRHDQHRVRRPERRMGRCPGWGAWAASCQGRRRPAARHAAAGIAVTIVAHGATRGAGLCPLPRGEHGGRAQCTASRAAHRAQCASENQRGASRRHGTTAGSARGAAADAITGPDQAPSAHRPPCLASGRAGPACGWRGDAMPCPASSALAEHRR